MLLCALAEFQSVSEYHLIWNSNMFWNTPLYKVGMKLTILEERKGREAEWVQEREWKLSLAFLNGCCVELYLPCNRMISWPETPEPATHALHSTSDWISLCSLLRVSLSCRLSVGLFALYSAFRKYSHSLTFSTFYSLNLKRIKSNTTHYWVLLYIFSSIVVAASCYGYACNR